MTAVWSRSEAVRVERRSSRSAWGMVLGNVVFGVSLGAGLFGEAVDGVPAMHPAVVLTGISVGLVTGVVSAATLPRDS